MSDERKYDYWIRSGKYTAITKFATLAIGIVSFILLARMLGASAFGVWALFMTISSIIETARISLIRNAFIRFTNQTSTSEHEGLQAAAFVLSGAISLMLAGSFFLLSSPIAGWLNAPGLDVMLRWYAITLLVNTFFAHYEMVLTAKTDFRGICIMYLSRQLILLAVICVCYIAKINVSPLQLSLFYLASVVVGTVSGHKLATPYLHWNVRQYKTWFARLWHFGKYVFGTNISALLFRSTDNFLTSAFISTAVSAYYNASLRISNMVDLPSQVLGDVAFTKATQLDSTNKASIKNMYEKTVGAILTFSIPALIGLLIFPTLIMRLLAGKEFVQGTSILRITAFFGFVLPFLKQYGTIMDATGHPHTNFQTNALAFVLNVIFNLIGIHFLGVTGAALGTATTYFFIFIITQRILYRKFGISFIQVFKNTIVFYNRLFQLVRHYTSRRILAIKAGSI